MACPRSHNSWVTELVFQPRSDREPNCHLSFGQESRLSASPLRQGYGSCPFSSLSLCDFRPGSTGMGFMPPGSQPCHTVPAALMSQSPLPLHAHTAPSECCLGPGTMSLGRKATIQLWSSLQFSQGIVLPMRVLLGPSGVMVTGTETSCPPPACSSCPLSLACGSLLAQTSFL